ncbi:MAG: hypothetical protein HS104_37535 [Polyangiaceae bacterium]|nr:hypothetical protein [Polyangiaceae bacterium]MCL4750976.1 hypothetical protein [Myxococcales bacterium]
MTNWLRRSLVLLLGLGAGALLLPVEAGCGGCHEGACECADGTKIRVKAAPCECRSACASHGGECSDDYAGCPIDGGDAGDD